MAEMKSPDGPPAYDAGPQDQLPQQHPGNPQQAPAPYPQQAPPYPQQAAVTAQPVGQPGMPVGQPGVPVGQPGVPVGQPGVPVGQPGVPVGQPGVQWQPQPTVVVNMPLKFTPLPMNVQCPNCGNLVTTVTEKQTGNVTWLTAGALCLFFLGCLLCPLGLIAFCIPALKDTIHTCPNCKFVVGKHSHL